MSIQLNKETVKYLERLLKRGGHDGETAREVLKTAGYEVVNGIAKREYVRDEHGRFAADSGGGFEGGNDKPITPPPTSPTSNEIKDDLKLNSEIIHESGDWDEKLDAHQTLQQIHEDEAARLREAGDEKLAAMHDRAAAAHEKAANSWQKALDAADFNSSEYGASPKNEDFWAGRASAQGDKAVALTDKILAKA